MSGTMESVSSAARASDEYCAGGPRWSWLPAIAIGTIAAILVAGVVSTAYGYVPAPPSVGSYPIFWPFFPLGFFLGLFVVFFAFRWAWWGRVGWGRSQTWSSGAGAREILLERYARGEISRVQLEQMSRDLDELR